MKTNPVALPPATSAAALSSSAAAAPSANTPEVKAGPGRPSCLNEAMIDALCVVIRETGASDSGAAVRVGLHPSTVSRWKQEHPDLAILLRAAREQFRLAQLSVIFATAQAGQATSWRAAAWLLERIFPEDYAPRARERAQFQERFDAVCAAEEEGCEVTLPTKGEPLQIVQNSALPTRPQAEAVTARAPELTLPLTAAPVGGVLGIRHQKPQLQNVKNSPLAGPLRPPGASTKTVVL